MTYKRCAIKGGVHSLQPKSASLSYITFKVERKLTLFPKFQKNRSSFNTYRALTYFPL